MYKLYASISKTSWTVTKNVEGIGKYQICVQICDDVFMPLSDLIFTLHVYDIERELIAFRASI